MLKRLACWGSYVGMMPIRLALGIIFFAHGGQKVLGWFGGHGLSTTIEFFQKGGIPPILGYIAAFTELLGGVLVIIGFTTRFAALGLAVVMLVAIFHVHLPNGFFLENHGMEYCVALLGMALTLVLFGPGKPAIDSKFCPIEKAKYESETEGHKSCCGGHGHGGDIKKQ